MGLDRQKEHMNIDHGFGAANPRDAVNIGYTIANSIEKPGLVEFKRAQVQSKELGGEKIQNILTQAPDNDAAMGGLKVIVDHGWFAARPSGTEDIYKIYAESFRGADHLRCILAEAQAIVSDTLVVEPETAADT
jgi:phosphoglucomutase